MKRGLLIVTLLGLSAFLTSVSVYAKEEKQTDRKKQKVVDKTPESDRKQVPNPNKSEWKEYILAEHEEFLTWLDKNYPDKHEELMELLDTQPKRFANRIGGVIRTYDPIRYAQKHNPPLAEVLQEDLILQHRRNRLLGEIQNADEKDREELLKQLEEVVATRFDIIIRKKELQIEALRKRLKKLEKGLEKKAGELETLKTEKDNNVDKRMKELLKDIEVDWN